MNIWIFFQSQVWPAGTASTLPKPTKLVELVEDIESGITQCNSTMAGDGQEPDHSLQPVREVSCLTANLPGVSSYTANQGVKSCTAANESGESDS